MTVGVYSGLLVVAPPRTGKSLFCITEIHKALRAGRSVATNLDLYLDRLMPPRNRSRVWRLPDWPSVGDLESMPLGNPALYRDERGQIHARDDWKEENNGLLVLDELGTFLQARTWQDKGRDAVIAWFLQAGKYGWNRIFIAQDIKLIDSQLRRSCLEQTAVVYRTDMLAIPFIGPALKFLGRTGLMPRLYWVAARRGLAEHSPIVWKHMFSGDTWYRGYNTRQVIDPDIGVPSGSGHWLLSAWELKGRRMGFWEMHRAVVLASLLLGISLGGVAGWFLKTQFLARAAAAVRIDSGAKTFSDDPVIGVIMQGQTTVIQLKSGKSLISDAVYRGKDSLEYRSGGIWYKGQL